MFNWNAYVAAVPEMFLATLALCLLVVGAIIKSDRSAHFVAVLTGAGFLITMVLVSFGAINMLGAGAFPRVLEPASGFMLVNDSFSIFSKLVLLVLSFVVVIFSGHYLKHIKHEKPEFYVLFILALLGMFIMVSAKDLITLYIGLEMMSFSLYILCAFQKNNTKSTEAGLKYFVLGSLASGLMLYGMSLLYGMTGGTEFSLIQTTLANYGTLADTPQGMTVAVALVFVLSGLAFKISAAPFHMWTPDVYEGAPTPVTAFMAVAPKLAAFMVLIRVLMEPLQALSHDWQMMLIVLSVLTMAVGSFLAIVQTNIKRLLAYSSIGHVGFMLTALVAGTEKGVAAILFYLVVYSMMTLGAFGVLLLLQRRGVYAEKISYFAGLADQSPKLAAAMAIFLFSLAGIPPFAGFFAKFSVFKAAVDAGYTWLALIGLLFSAVAVYYSLKIVKIMYFEKGTPQIDTTQPRYMRFVVTALACAMLYFGIFPDWLNDMAHKAAASLF